MFIKSINKDKNVVESILVFSKGVVVYYNVFLGSRQNKERIKESRLFILGGLNSLVSIIVIIILLNY